MNGYCIIRSTDPEGMSKAIETLQKQGWQCQGGVAITTRKAIAVEVEVYVQAMVKP